MSPLPGWGVIPGGWAERHQPTTDATHTAPAVFRRLSDGPPPYPLPDDWDGTTAVWETAVRVQELKRENAGTAAEQPVYVRDYQVTTTTAGPPIRTGEHGDVIDVLGRRLQIVNEQFGSLIWERVFTCVDNLTQQNPD